MERFENGRAALRGEAAEHLGHVLRAQAGQFYELSDGAEVWLGRVERASKNAVEFSLLERIAVRVPRLQTVLWLSIVKFDRFEWALEKATELGVGAIQPLAAERSEKGLLAASAKRAERWQRILVESAQQSRRLAAPKLAPIAGIGEACATTNPADARILLSERADAPHLRVVLGGQREASSAVLAIGPEGGWTDGEMEHLRGAGFREASLGSTILRTETAVIAALAAINYALGEDS